MPSLEYDSMQTSVLAKPDMKVFVVMALLVVGFHAVLTSWPLPERYVALVNATEVYHGSELGLLLAKAANHPDSATFLKLSGHYQQTGQYKTAMFMARNAQNLQVWEDE